MPKCISKPEIELLYEKKESYEQNDLQAQDDVDYPKIWFLAI